MPARRMVALALGALVLVTLAIGAPSSQAAPQADGDDRPAGRYDPDRVLVAFRQGVSGSQRAQTHARHGGRVENRMEWLNLDVVRVPEGADPLEAAARYETGAGVAYAHPNWELHLASVPNDPFFRDLWGLHNTGQLVTGGTTGTADADIDAPEAWDAAFGAGSFPSTGGVRVGILDTGIDQAHIDLLGKTKACASALTGTGIVLNGSCADDNLHGTHVAGTVAAIADNGVGVAGVAPNAELAVFKALNSAGTGFYADVIAGIHWLHTTGSARIINMSLGGPQDDALDRELTDAASAGALLVAAAGNDGDSTANYPAYHPDVVSVAATNSKDARASFSNCNADVELAAPGVDVWSTIPGNAYVALNGTSMATPHVSGAAAVVMWSRGTDATTTRSILASSAEDRGPAGWDSCYGHGRINLAAALGASTEPSPTPDPGGLTGSVTDTATSAGIAGALVDCGSGGSATTASDGSYGISGMPAGSHTCTASATGYRSKSQTVTITSNQTTVANFALRARR